MVALTKIRLLLMRSDAFQRGGRQAGQPICLNGSRLRAAERSSRVSTILTSRKRFETPSVLGYWPLLHSSIWIDEERGSSVFRAWEQVLRLAPGDPADGRELIPAGRAAVSVGC